MTNGAKLTGIGHLYRGPRDLGSFKYAVELEPNGQGTLVKFDHSPHAKDGEVLHLALEDGRFLLCQHLDRSPYCAVVGDGPRPDKRHEERPPGYGFQHQVPG